MGRTITLTNGNDSFRQSAVGSNFELVIRSLAGNDTIRLDRSDDLGGGNNVATAAGNDSIINSKEFGNIIGMGDGNDTYVGLGFGSFGSDVIDQVFGGAGNDTFAIQTFHSWYFGGEDNDTFHSVGWQNRFNGGNGVDTISYQPRGDDSTVGGTGVLINLGAGFAQTGTSRQETLNSIENAIGSVQGDTIIGSSGANRLNGAAGFDDVTGGAGADVFAFNSVNQARFSSSFVDVIEDFHRVEGDKIDLRVMDANTLVAGNQAFRFVANFGGHAGELKYDGQFFSGDVNGDGVADFRALMNGVASMVSTDFLL